jgi:hypothetical protein
MKIFDSSPGILLKRPMPWRKIAVAILSAVLFVSLGAYTWYQQRSAEERYKAVTQELAAVKAEAKDLKEKLAVSSAKIGDLSSTSNVCTQSLQAEINKTGAFAKQAAVCETLRLKLNRKG